jgi:hypothetical protein
LSWSSLRSIFSVQQRITVTFKQQDGRTLHVHIATVAETNLSNIYNVLVISASPGEIKKLVI